MFNDNPIPSGILRHFNLKTNLNAFQIFDDDLRVI